MKLIIQFLIKVAFLILFSNIVIAADKFEGSGDLKLDDPDIKWFLKYLKPPAGQVPMVFFVLAEDGKAIWSTYWYCPEGNCSTLSKSSASSKCTADAEKYYKRSIFEECKIFARRRTIVWKNGINPGRGKISKASSKFDENQLRAKLTELGFLGNNISSNNTTTKKKKLKKDKTTSESTNSTSEISNDKIKKLKDLKKLLDEGILTKEEFDSEKKKILE